VDARSPKFDGGIVTRVDSVPFSVTVNKSGERFYDEGEDWWPKRYAVWGQLIARQPDQVAYSIFDRDARDLFIPSVYAPLAADSLDGLLAQLDVDRDQALRTIEEFNAAVDESVPFDSTRKDGRQTIATDPPRTNWARKIRTAPFYAFPLAPGVTFTYFGLRVDENARVATSDGLAFENVYAAGEVMAGNILTSGYLAGFGLTIGSVFGRIAGDEAADGH
jgi:tricarballylate dehydrogenase